MTCCLFPCPVLSCNKGSYIAGVLTRCLRSLEESDNENTEATRTTEALKEVGSYNLITVIIFIMIMNVIIYICVCVYIYIYIYIYTQTDIYIYIYIYKTCYYCDLSYLNIWENTQFGDKLKCGSFSTYIYTCIYIYIYIYI